ncbi:MAG: hydrogenase maturation protease [Pseudomonadota bacterium]
MSVKVIGVGNAFRRDDGAGIAAVNLLRERASASFDIAVSSAEPSELMTAWEGADVVILLDAAAAGSAPGKITRTVIGKTPLPPDASGASTHDLGVAAAIALAEALDERPETVIVYTIEGADFGFGEDLSKEVVAALPMLIDQVAQETAKLSVEELRHA